LYGMRDAAKIIIEKALGQSAMQFKRAGAIWEFYDSLAGNPENVKRKPQTQFNRPRKDYLGQNLLIEKARMYYLAKYCLRNLMKTRFVALELTSSF